MTAIEFLQKLDLNKIDLFKTTERWLSRWDTGIAWHIDPTPIYEAPKYYSHGFNLLFKDQTLKEYPIGVSYDSEFKWAKIEVFGLTYYSKDLSRKEREWLEDYTRYIADEVRKVREEKLNTFLISE